MSAPTPGSSRLPTPTQEELEAILRAANAQAASGRPLAVPTPKRPEKEHVDERCWIRGRQTNAKRALGREPTTTAWCYINLRKQISQMKPVPGIPGAYMGHDVPIPSPPPASKSATTPSVDPDQIPEYHWGWLDGRYIYRAKGRKYVTNHMEEMGGDEWKGIEKIQERCEKDGERRMEPGYREERMMRKAMGLDLDNDFESLTSLSFLFSNTLRRFHTHILRIYTPGIKNLLRLPSTFTDGTQSQTINNVWLKLTDGSAFVLANRMVESTKEVSKRLKERRNGGDGGAGGMGPSLPGLGGSPPPVTPPP